jgi:molybdopterin-guanine dinucleotide biosynthesis protein A
MPMVEPGVAAIVLAGGRASRLDGEPKPLLELEGVSLLQRAVTALREVDCGPVIVVGPVAAGLRGVDAWVREEPEYGGPVAAIAAALPHVRTGGVMVLAADLARPDLAVAALLASDPHPDGAVLVDPGGREQWLAAVYRAAGLREGLLRLAPAGSKGGGSTAGGSTRGDGVAGASMRALVGGLDVARIPATRAAVADIDTWEDLEHARREAAAES